jgi:drug/metabolite transporter (DMT)-like permease
LSAAPQTRAAAGATARTKPTRPRFVYLYLAIIVISWALNWPLMKLALADAPPVIFVLLRLAGTLGVLLPVILAMRVPLLPQRGERLGLFWVGQLQIGGFLIASVIGLSIVPAGRAIVLAYTMPLWVIPVELWLEPERIGRFQLLGATIGFAGLLLFMNPGLVDWSSSPVLAANAMLVVSAICWGLGSVLYRRRAWRSNFWAQTFWQMAVSAVAAALLTAFLPAGAQGPVHWSPALIAALAYNWLITMPIGYYLWNKVLAVMSAGVAGQVMALTPVGGFLLSAAIFGGAITPDIVVSICLIVLGIIVTLRS